MHTHNYTYTHRYIDMHVHTDTDTHTDTETQTDTDTYIHTYIHIGPEPRIFRWSGLFCSVKVISILYPRKRATKIFK